MEANLNKTTIQGHRNFNNAPSGFRRNAVWFVSTNTEMIKVTGKGAAIKKAKETGGLLIASCSCGCGEAAGKALVLR